MTGSKKTAPRRAGPRRPTRERIIRAAGELFAERGYLGATAREVAAKAGVNPASINYHFDGKEGLYDAVLAEARQGFAPSLREVREALPCDAPVWDRLEALVRYLVAELLSHDPSRWHFKLMVREMTFPSERLLLLLDQEMAPRAEIMSGLTGEILGLPPDHRLSRRAASMVIAYCLHLHQNRGVIARLFPQVPLTGQEVDGLVDDYLVYVRGGLKALAERVREEGEHDA
ncbi:TetR/AcrR family transcriptional regulator [Desulfohalovibrio reitneri]|uniref:TetR/AcrR family transcriptional regulator n=1 Tax=Desulfohalovibrio reitneri TaxID=1307759 RepID=UPI0004A6EFC6|nr:TetR/AcrR family transcriptional regulator [Desulfohalovibrio reitneri]